MKALWAYGPGLRKGRYRTSAQGQWWGGNPPYGFEYDKSTKQLRHHEAEKPQVVGVFNCLAEGKSIGSLITNLNRLGITTRHGKPWTRQQILKMLRNSIYAGRAYWGKRERRNRTVVATKGTEERILIPVTPIVSEEVFQKVQRQLDKNRITSPRNTKHVHLLQNLLRCRVCNKPFAARTRTRGHGKVLKTPARFYGCQGMKQSPGAYYCRKPVELYAATLENVVWDKVAAAFSDPDSLLQILRARNATATEKAGVIKAELDRAQQQLGKRNSGLQQVLSWARQNLLSADELKPQLAQVREEKQHWETEVQRLNEKLASVHAADGDMADAEKWCLSIRGRLTNLTPEQKKEFLHLVVERIWVDEHNNMEIEVVIPKPEKQPNDAICETPFS